MAVWTTAEILNAIKPRAGLPSANGLLTDAEILQIATEVQDTLVSEALRTAGGSYGVQVAADVAIASGTAVYALPTRGQNAGALSVWFVDSGGALSEVTEVPPEESWRYQNIAPDFGNGPYAFCVEGDSLRLLPTPSASTGSIRVKYFERPGRLVETSRCAPVLSATNTLKLQVDTATQAPSSLITTAGAYFDLISGEPPFSTIARARLTSSYLVPQLDLNSSTPVVVADVPTRAASDNRTRTWACPVYETCVPQLPLECHALLIAGTVRDVLEAKKDAQGVAIAERTTDRELGRLRRMLESRVRAGGSAVTNHRSPYREGRWGSR